MNFSAKVHVSNGHLLKPKNRNRIMVHALQPCHGVIHKDIGPEYHEVYRLEKRKTGWGWTETTHGMGISGYHSKTVRDAVILILIHCQGRFVVTFHESFQEGGAK